MGNVQFYNSEVLFAGGQVAMDPACCCSSSSSSMSMSSSSSGSGSSSSSSGGPEPCPDDCSGCCATYTVTINVTNPDTKCDEFMGDIYCSHWNGTWNFNRDGDTCSWDLAGGESDMRCEDGIWIMQFYSIFFYDCIIEFTAPNVDDCPPDDPSDWTCSAPCTCQATITGITKSDCP